MVLARALRNVMGPAASTSAADVSTMSSTALQAALREYEVERSSRVLKISVRSNLMGTVLQIPFAPVSPFPLLDSGSLTEHLLVSFVCCGEHSLHFLMVIDVTQHYAILGTCLLLMARTIACNCRWWQHATTPLRSFCR